MYQSSSASEERLTAYQDAWYEATAGKGAFGGLLAKLETTSFTVNFQHNGKYPEPQEQPFRMIVFCDARSSLQNHNHDMVRVVLGEYYISLGITKKLQTKVLKPHCLVF